MTRRDALLEKLDRYYGTYLRLKQKGVSIYILDDWLTGCDRIAKKIMHLERYD